MRIHLQNPVDDPLFDFSEALWQAAADESTQAFLLIGTLLLIPIIRVYTAWSYWVFRGKVRTDLVG